MFGQKIDFPKPEYVGRRVVFRGKTLSGKIFRYYGVIRDVNGTVMFVDWDRKPSAEANTAYRFGKAAFYLQD